MVQYESRMAAQSAAQSRPTSGLHEQGQMRMVERRLMAVEAVWIRMSKVGLSKSRCGKGEEEEDGI